MKITKEQFKNIVREVMTEESEYQKFFAKALEKTGKSIPDMSDEEKKAFFNKIDAAWDGKGEKKNEGNAFGAAVQQAKKDGEDEFEVGGEKFKVEEAKSTTISAPGNWVAYLSMTRGKMLLKVFDTARGAKQYLSKNVDKLLGLPHVESVGIMTKKEWDSKEAKYAIESVNETSSKEKEIYSKIEKLRVLSNSGKITGDEFLDKFMPLWKQLKGMKSESVVNEGKLGDTWRKNNKKGYVLKVGNIELKSAGPSNSHDILVNRMPWGTFAIDYEAGGTDWWVKPLRGSDFWVKSIDDLVKKVKA